MSYFKQVDNRTVVETIAMTGLWLGKTARVIKILGSRSQGWNSTSVFGDVCDYLNTTQNLLNTPTSEQTLYLRSSSASDAAAGNGALTVRTVYLDASGNQQVRTDTLTGTTVVNIGSGYTFIQWMETASLVGTGVVAAGNLTISSTNGAPTVATTFEQITVGGNRSLSGRYKVPTGYTGYLLDWKASAISATMDTRLRVDKFSDDDALVAGVFHFNGRIFLSSGQLFGESLNFEKCPAGAVIKLSAIPGSAPAGISWMEVFL